MSTNQHRSDNLETNNMGSHHELVPSSPEVSVEQSLADALRHLLSQQGYPVDNIRLQDVIRKHNTPKAQEQGRGINTLGGCIGVLRGLGLKNRPRFLNNQMLPSYLYWLITPAMVGG